MAFVVSVVLVVVVEVVVAVVTAAISSKNRLINSFEGLHRKKQPIPTYTFSDFAGLVICVLSRARCAPGLGR